MELTRRVWDVVNFQRASQTSNHHHRALFDCFDASGKNEWEKKREHFMLYGLMTLDFSVQTAVTYCTQYGPFGRAGVDHLFSRSPCLATVIDELVVFFAKFQVLIGWFGRAKAMSDDSVLGALYGRREVPSVFELEQRVLALHCSYKQRQSSLVEQFQRSQQELAVRHYAESQHLLDEFMKERSCHAPVARHASLPTMSSPIPRANSIEASTSTNGSSPASCASGVQTSGTISDRTKEKLKAFIYGKRRRQLSSSDDSRQHFAPYPIPTGDFHQLRKVCSEPELDSRLASLRNKLPDSVVFNEAASTTPLTSPCCRDFPSLLWNSNGVSSLAFPAPSLPCLPSYVAHATGGDGYASTSVEPLNGFLRNSALFLSAPSLAGASTAPAALPTLSVPSFIGGPLAGGGLPLAPAEALAQAASLYGHAFAPLSRACANPPTVGVSPMEQYQYNVLRQQLRDLVLRRKSLVREETDDEVAREGNGPSLLPRSLASLGLSDSGDGNTPKTTGIAFDLLMARHDCICSIKGQHIEEGERIKTIWSHLQSTDLFEKCKKLNGRKAPLEYLRLCHDECYTTFFGVSPTACLKTDPTRLPLRSFIQLPCGGIGVDADTYFNDGSTQLSARVAVGCTVDLCLAVAAGTLENGFALVRPPGHHAEPVQAMGFCFFNNIAIAVRVLQQKKPHLKKFAIIDWDVHHGKGTQLIFENDPNVLYLSLHRYDNGTFFPGTGSLTEVGSGAGAGFTVNIAWSGGSMGDADYLAAFAHVVLPILDQFEPDFVLVAAGFDAADGHHVTLGGYHLSPAIFAHMTRSLLRYADSRLVLVLEGGYELKVVNECIEECLRVLCGQESRALSAEALAASPSESAQTVLRQLINEQRPYWPILDPKAPLSCSFRQLEAMKTKK
ncbi:Histone deacetylase 4 [Trichinella spiralis]|uniref:histone deacetylase n=2 Tax=Trichinella spiralis TaxID=6334 RepID=A0A0V1BG82_TRISP|nr:Histone deacetylase 4 [Trichinella spiralis]